MLDMNKAVENDTQKRRQLRTTNVTEWTAFLNDELLVCRIRPLHAFFFVDANITHCDDSFAFASIKASPHRIYNKRGQIYDCFYIIASRGGLSWRNGKLSGTLPFGGVVIFDCNDTMSCDVESDQEIVSFLLPYSYVKAHNISLVDARKMRQPIYGAFIAELMQSMRYDDADLFFKMRAVANLLMLSVDERKMVSRGETEFRTITGFINDNILNNWLSLDFVSTSLGMSKSKIQKILLKHNLSYGEMVKVARVEVLAAKIKYNKDKTIAELCYDCGFNTTSNAAVQFKKVKNISIAEYRKNSS